MEGHACQSRMVVQDTEQPSTSTSFKRQTTGLFGPLYDTHSIAHRYLSWLHSISLSAINLPPFGNLGFCRYKSSFRQFHSRFFPDGRIFYSLTSLELEESVVCGQSEPEDGGDSHEEGFEG
jgi:hypothetical protein